MIKMPLDPNKMSTKGEVLLDRCLCGILIIGLCGILIIGISYWAYCKNGFYAMLIPLGFFSGIGLLILWGKYDYNKWRDENI